MTQQEEKEKDPLDNYDGPWIEKRIEWVCESRKQSVELFGSWNRFKGGDELEYQGQNIYAVTVKLPLGTYVFRFLIDGEEYETNHNEAKAIRDGVEYNSITVKGANEAESSEDEEAVENTEEPNEQMLTFDESTGGFVVGKSKKKKRDVAVQVLKLSFHPISLSLLLQNNPSKQQLPHWKAFLKNKEKLAAIKQSHERRRKER